jgi:hypothetical protein
MAVVQSDELARVLECEERFPAFLNALQKKMVKKRPAMKKGQGTGRGGAMKRITFEGMAGAESAHRRDERAGGRPATAANAVRTVLNGSKVKKQREVKMDKSSDEGEDDIDDGDGQEGTGSEVCA